MNWQTRIIYLVLSFFSIIILVSFALPKHQRDKTHTSIKIVIPTSIPTPTPFIFISYTPPFIQQKQTYTVVMIGDSMTAALGPHGGGLSDYMNSLYKKNPQDPQRIIINNYAKSSNILAVNEELNWKTTIDEYTFGPLLSEDFDVILVESYGYNPLSQFGLEGGIKAQNKALDTLMGKIITTHPHAAIVFVATISPNREYYAQATQPNYSSSDRATLANERIEYIKNHITYAKNHNIPLVNIYQDSLTENGEGNMIYVNPTDDIHPSFVGIDFIDHEIGDYIYKKKILPQ